MDDDFHTNEANIVNSLQLCTKEDEVTNFTDEIGKTIIISNERDKTVVTHLIEYIKNYQKDKENLIGKIFQLTTENEDLHLSVSSLKQENNKLRDQSKLDQLALVEQKEQFVDAARALSIESLSNNGILDEKVINSLKDEIHGKTIESYKETIQKQSEDLKLMETQIEQLKNELKISENELTAKSLLEIENSKLQKEVIESRNSNFDKMDEQHDVITEQKEMIAEQIEMMQLMESDILRLENIIHEMNVKLSHENENKSQLLQQLKVKEDEIEEAKLKREKSTTNLISKFSTMRTTNFAKSLFSDQYNGIDGSTEKSNRDGDHGGPANHLNWTRLSTFASIDAHEIANVVSTPRRIHFDHSDMESPPLTPKGGNSKQTGPPIQMTLLGSSINSTHESDELVNNDAKVQISKSELLSLRRQIDELKGSKLSLINQLNEKKQELLKMQTENEDLHEEIDDLKEDMQTKKENNKNIYDADYTVSASNSNNGESDTSARHALLHAATKDAQTGSCVLFGTHFW